MELKTKKKNDGGHIATVPSTKVSLRRRIEILEEVICKLREEISPVKQEIKKIKDYVGIS